MNIKPPSFPQMVSVRSAILLICLIAVLVVPVMAAQQITNGGFETTGGWSAISNGGQSYHSTSSPHTGTYCLMMYVDEDSDYTFYQNVNFTDVSTLTFWDRRNYDAISEPNYFAVYIDTDCVWSSTTESPSWTMQSVDVSSYSGVHTLKFFIQLGQGYGLDWRLDDISALSGAANFTSNVTTGYPPLSVLFTDTSTADSISNWSWDFDNDGDVDSYEQNPVYTYTNDGTYTVNLTVTNPDGTDSEVKHDYVRIYEMWGGTGNITYIYSDDQDYVPFPIWLLVLVVTIAFFVHSIMIARFADITSGLSAVFSGVVAWLSNMITFTNIEVNQILGNVTVQPVQYVIHPPWLVYTMLIFFFVSIINVIRVWYVTYLKQPRQEA